MVTEKERLISSLIGEIDQLSAHYQRLEYWRDNFEHGQIEVVTKSRRSGTFHLDISNETIYDLFTEKMNKTSLALEECHNKILKLRE